MTTTTSTSPEIPKAVDPLKGTRYSLAPVMLKKIDQRNKLMNTDNNGKMVASTMVGDDLIKKINIGVNTELVKGDVVKENYLKLLDLKKLRVCYKKY
jgi:hypothetical protein